MQAEEIVLPETKPETEWVRGRALQKMSPRRNHGRVQMSFASKLDAWALGHGEVVTEWRFRLAPPGEVRRPLIPDIAFVSIARLRGLSEEEIQTPDFAPDVAIEVRSPGDRRSDFESKRDVYLACGTRLVLLIDPKSRTFVAYDALSTKKFSESHTFEHAELPDFTLDLASFFSRALDLSA